MHAIVFAILASRAITLLLVAGPVVAIVLAVTFL